MIIRMDLKKCGICLLDSSPLISVNESDSNGEKWSTKIYSITSEVVEVGDYLICKDCIRKVNEFLEFKISLLNIITRWKCFIQNENSSQSQNIEFCKNNYENSEIYMNPVNIAVINNVKNEITEEIHNITNNDSDVEYERCDRIDDTYNCIKCLNFYSSLKNLQAHKKYCPKELTTPLSEDIIISTDRVNGRRSSRTFICELCKEEFNKVSLITNHYITTHSYSKQDIKPYDCDRCEQKFATLGLLHQHLKYHNKERTKMCSTCGKSFITYSDLLSHQYIHLNRRNYKCTECSKAFNTNKNLRTHILVVHTDRSLWKYHCKLCDQKFPQKSNFDLHLRRHAGDKQHSCHVCQKTFVSSNELKRHIRLHTHIKLFRCTPCGRDYKSQRSYRQHVIKKHLHTEKKLQTTKIEQIIV